VVVDILKPNHSSKTAANRQVRFKGLGLSNLGRWAFRCKVQTCSPWWWGYIGCNFLKIKNKKKKNWSHKNHGMLS
jgi:hypothetical protein